jgi:ankyrin repeat protein
MKIEEFKEKYGNCFIEFKGQYGNCAREKLKDELIVSCEVGDLARAEFLLNHTELRNRYDITEYFSNIIVKASKQGHIHIIKFLNESLNDEEKKEIGPYHNTLLVGACRDGNLEVIRYLLTSEDIKDSVDIHAGDDDAIDWACSMGHLEVVKYLTSSPEITKHVNINESKNAFIVACANGNFDIIRHFIFDLNMKKAVYIELFLDNNPVEEVEKMFAIRDLNQSLGKELVKNEVAEKKIKL